MFKLRYAVSYKKTGTQEIFYKSDYAYTVCFNTYKSAQQVSNCPFCSRVSADREVNCWLMCLAFCLVNPFLYYSWLLNLFVAVATRKYKQQATLSLRELCVVISLISTIIVLLS